MHKQLISRALAPRLLVVACMALLTLVLGGALGAQSAHAEIRSTTVADAADATPTLSGVPNNPDIESVAGSYETGGSFTLVVRFYHPLDSVDYSTNYAMSGSFSIGTADPASSSPYCSTLSNGISGQHHVSSSITTFYDRFSVAGFDGYQNATRTISPDKLQITITGSSGAIAGKGYNCFTYSLNSRRRSTIDNIYSHYDEGCDCWYVNSELDNVGNAGSNVLPFAWFDGFAPPPRSDEPTDNRKGTKLDIQASAGCRWVGINYWEVTPDRIGGKMRAWGGRLVLELRKHNGDLYRRKKLKIKNDMIPEFRSVRPGRYRLKVWYTGDTYRLPSRVHSQSIRAKSCR